MKLAVLQQCTFGFQMLDFELDFSELSRTVYATSCSDNMPFFFLPSCYSACWHAGLIQMHKNTPRLTHGLMGSRPMFVRALVCLDLGPLDPYGHRFRCHSIDLAPNLELLAT